MYKGIKSPSSGLKGFVDRALARNLERILRVPGRKLYAGFEASCQDVRETQLGVLREIMDYAAETEIGRKHGFAGIRSHRDLQDALPIRDYEDFRPWVDRHARGEENLLFPGKPLMYNRSSGTTAKPKLLPVTHHALERTIQNRSKLWLYNMMHHFPGIYAGKDLTLVSPAVEGHTEDGTPYGSLSGLVYRNIPGFMKNVHSVPEDTILIRDYLTKLYTLLRFALGSDVSCIISGNPATVVNMATRADAWKERIIRDIRDGTLRADLHLEPTIRGQCEALLRPDPERAAQLEALAEAHGQLRPADYWPNLRLIHTWKHGNCRLVLPQLEPWFGAIPSLDFGYIASELTATDVILPHNDGSVLQVQNAFYEFSREEEGDAPDRRFFLAHELEPGGRYFVHVTTFSGLYRYDMNDVVEVLERFGQAPVLRFLYKGKGITSLQGEKLSEAQLIEAMGRAERETGTAYGFFVGWADPQAQRYDLYVEFPFPTDHSERRRFASAVDKALSEVNVEYEAKRASQRLAPPRVIPLVADAFDRYRDLRLEEGALSGQLKWLHLSGTAADLQRMRQLAAPGVQVATAG
jgi:hypothetical protein